MLSFLEGQIVGRTFSRLLCRRERSNIGICCRSRLLRSKGSSTSLGSYSNGSSTTNNIIGADFVEPTSIILVGINIELDGNIFVHLNVKLLNTVFAKDAEQTLARILSRNFDNILLRHPRVTRALRDTTISR